MKNIGIKYLLRITTLIPAFLVALLFALLYNGLFGNDLKQHMSRLGEAYIRQLVPAAQYAMLRQDDRTLQGLINASTINPEVKGLAFYNNEGKLLAYRGGKHAIHTPFNPPKFTGDYIDSKQINPFTINFIAPVAIPKFNLYSKLPKSEENAFHPDNILGWLSLDIDTRSMLIKRYQMIIVTIFITLFGLLISLSTHHFLSKQIYLPINKLRRSMKQILRNEFETEIKASSRGELGLIEKGCMHLQRKYLNSVNELNHHIEIATADLQQSLLLLEEKNIELSLEKKKAEEKSKQQSEFIANMSHEIRTPMNGVIGFTNVLLESKLDPLQLDYVKTIKTSAQELLVIINDILDFSKMDAGKLQLDCIPLNIRHCIDEVLTLASPYAHKKGIDLFAISDVNIPKTVLGDSLRIKQIINNLVTNAVKFTDQGYVLIRTRIEEETDKDYTLCFIISDTGVGISPEDQTKLFTAFSQADTSIARRFGGSGLGLVICKQLCEAMQGKVALTSELNKGSEFFAQIKVSKLQSYEIEKNQVHYFSSLKILCFDDNLLHLEALCNGLSYWGIHCIPVNTFQELPKALSENKECQLAFINVNQGCEQQIAHLINLHPYFPYVLTSKWHINNHQALGAQAVLSKPISIQKLQETIETIHDKKQMEPLPQEVEKLRKKLRELSPHILIAEDNPINKMLLESLLSAHTKITAVDNGNQAVKACESQKFQLILMDLHMPELNGLETAKIVREQSPFNQKTPIILISASANTLNNRELKKMGIQLFLQKPVDEKQLLAHILNLSEKPIIPAINWTLCVQRLSGNETFAEEFLAQFVAELPNYRSTILQHYHQKEFGKLADSAHKLLGSCCFCGVPTLQNWVAEVEKLALSQLSLHDLEHAIQCFTQSLDAVLADYENYRKQEKK